MPHLLRRAAVSSRTRSVVRLDFASNLETTSRNLTKQKHLYYHALHLCVFSNNNIPTQSCKSRYYYPIELSLWQVVSDGAVGAAAIISAPQIAIRCILLG